MSVPEFQRIRNGSPPVVNHCPESLAKDSRHLYDSEVVVDDRYELRLVE